MVMVNLNYRKEHKHNKDQSTNFQCDYIIFYSWILFDCVFFYVTGKHLITSTIARNRHNSNFVVYNIINNEKQILRLISQLIRRVLYTADVVNIYFIIVNIAGF